MQLESIITISGRIASGKSYAAQLVSDQFEIPIASFGEYLRNLSQNIGFSANRTELQNLGQDLIATNPRQFLLDVISQSVGSAASVILDGVRHESIYSNSMQLTKNHIGIFVTADRQTRCRRFAERFGAADDATECEQFDRAESHPVEAEVGSLELRSDIVVDSTSDYSAKLFHFLSNRIRT